MTEVRELIERGKVLVDSGYRNISLRRKRGLVVFENPEGHQKCISVRKLQEDEVKMLLETLRSYRVKKVQRKPVVAPRSRIRDERAYKIVEEIWKDPAYLSEFLSYGPDYVLDLYFSDIDFDHETARSELRWRLLKLGKEMIRKGREERNPLYLLSGNLLRDEAFDFRGFRNLKLSEKHRRYLGNKYPRAWSKVVTNEKWVLEGIALDYLRIPRELWDRWTVEIYGEFMEALEHHYDLKQQESGSMEAQDRIKLEDEI